MIKINENTWKFVRVGREPRFKDPEELEEQIRLYFEQVAAEEGKLLITGLAGIFGSWTNLNNYAKKDGFRELIAYAKLMIEQSYEVNLSSKYTSGAVFALKNIGNWVDKTEQAQIVEVKQQPAIKIGSDEVDFGYENKQIEGETEETTKIEGNNDDEEW